MSYPKLILKIQNFIPIISFQPENGMSRVITTDEEDLSELLKNVVEKLELSDEFKEVEVNLYTVNELAQEGIINFEDEMPEIFTTGMNSFNLEENIEKFLTNNLIDQEDLEDYKKEASTEVLKELRRNQNLDLLANSINFLNYVIAQHLISVARDLKTNKIAIQDKDSNIRLQSQLSNELNKEGIEFEFID